MKLALVFLSKGWDLVPPVNLVSLATYVAKKSKSKPEIRIIDANFEDVFASIKNYDPDMIGISSMSPEYSSVIDLCKKIKGFKDIPIILGGTHISAIPKSLDEHIDIGVIGEGEETLKQLVDLYDDKEKVLGQYLNQIKGIVFHGKEELVITERRDLFNDLDEIPKIDWSFIDKRYFGTKLLYVPSKYGKEGILYSSRGCPYKCLFCSSAKLWKNLRYFSATRAIEEIKDLIINYNVDVISVWDDLFSADKGRLKEIITGLERERLLGKVEFYCQERANLLDEEKAKLLKKLNVKYVHFGLESGSDSYLKKIKSGPVSLEANKRAIRICKKYGIQASGSLIFGGPGETLEDMKETLNLIDFCKKNGVTNLSSFVMAPLPGAKAWEIAKQRGKVSDDMNWQDINYHSVDNPPLLDKDIGISEFKEMYNLSREKSNYFRRKRILRLVRNSPFYVMKETLFKPEFVYNSVKNIIVGKFGKNK